MCSGTFEFNKVKPLGELSWCTPVLNGYQLTPHAANSPFTVVLKGLLIESTGIQCHRLSSLSCCKDQHGVTDPFLCAKYPKARPL